MKFRLTVKKKLSTTEFDEAVPVKSAAKDGVFEAPGLPVAKNTSNEYIRSWAEGSGVRLRSQKDWAKNLKTKAMEKSVMVQNGAAAETYLFVLEQI